MSSDTLPMLSASLPMRSDVERCVTNVVRFCALFILGYWVDIVFFFGKDVCSRQLHFDRAKQSSLPHSGDLSYTCLHPLELH